MQLRCVGSYRHKLDSFFDNFDSPEITPTKAAFCTARQKVLPSAFHELSRTLSDQSVDFELSTWHGMRVAAIDGSTVKVPDTPENRSIFGTHKPDEDGRAMARTSLCYDPLNHIAFDGILDKYSRSEYSMADEHISKVQDYDLLIFDRYYASWWLIARLINSGKHFLFRMSRKWKSVRALLESDDNDRLVTVKMPVKYKKQMTDLPETITVRLVKYTDQKGQTFVYATSLPYHKKYNIKALHKLYWHRWQIEEGYKRIKTRLILENWTGKKAICLRQDFAASLVLLNLSALLCLAAKAPKKLPDTTKNKNKLRIYNRTLALTKTKNLILKIFQTSAITRWIKKAIHDIGHQTEIVTRGLSKERKKSPKTVLSMGYMIC